MKHPEVKMWLKNLRFWSNAGFSRNFGRAGTCCGEVKMLNLFTPVLDMLDQRKRGNGDAQSCAGHGNQVLPVGILVFRPWRPQHLMTKMSKQRILFAALLKPVDWGTQGLSQSDPSTGNGIGHNDLIFA